MVDDRSALLTDEQRGYLRLVHGGLTSKEIAQKLGGSHHTVNSEIAIAVRFLGARTRAAAAAIVAATETTGSYERSYEPPAVAPCDALEANEVAGKASIPSDRFSLPIPTAGRTTNDLTFWQRTMWILVIAAVTALVAGGLASGIIAQLEAIGRHV